jgi:hypothetical protein
MLRTASRNLDEAGVTTKVEASKSPTTDGRLRVDTPTGLLTYEIELKSRVSTNSAATLVTEQSRRRVIVTEYVSDPVAAILHRSGVHYMDTAGNMYLRGPGLLIDIRGRPRRPTTDDLKPATLRAFRASGVRVLFSLLCEPESVAAPYRQIAHRSSVSLGTVQKVLTELDETGYVYSDGQRRLQRLSELLDRWVEAYTLNLWPKLTLGRFDTTDHDWWRRIDPILRATEAQWGGETAAHRLQTRLSPEKAVIYAATIPSELVIAGRLRKAQDQGDVEIRRRFWNFDEDQPPITVPTPLVYADLLATADPRQREAAEHLRANDKLLRRLSNS